MPGTRLGPYEVVSLVGAGGMGEVYRARDTKLGRDVALKLLPDSFTHDPERLARFRREAQVLASLNHPHIAQIYGLEESNGTQFLVLELVDGESLDKRIARGPIPVDEALEIAKQIAEALQAAHEKGIIHRDLKPANIALSKDVAVKVLDFGLAKAVDPTVGATGDAMNSPTITSPAMMTSVAVILGTAAYMAPEQAKGRAADKRSDIWAFGCVLYEMLTGRRTFEGDDISDTLAAVLRGEPAWNALPADLGPPIRVLLRRCLTRDPHKRIADISTVLFALEEEPALAASTEPSTEPLDPRRDVAPSALRAMRRRRVFETAAAVIITAAVVGAATAYVRRPAAPRVSRLLIAPTPTAALAINGGDRDVAIAADGSLVVYGAANGTALVVRALDTLDGKVLTGLGLPRGPFVSPDGQWIGFVDTANGTIKKVAVTGGPAVTIATLDGSSRGASWSSDGSIIFATTNDSTGLQRVSEHGGAVTVLTRPDHAHGEADHLWPEVLPGGRAVLFTITPLIGNLDQAQVAVLDLTTGRTTTLVRGGSDARYAPSGHLVYAAGGALRAVRFDLTHLTAVGTPVPVVPQVVASGFGAVDVAVAQDGTVVYVPGVDAERRLVWLDRQGRETVPPAPMRMYSFPRIAPDGRRIVVANFDQQFDLWLWDVTTQALTRTTFDPAFDGFPVWRPDGQRLFFSSARAGPRNLFTQPADGGAADRLTDSPHTQYATSVSPDSRYLVFTDSSGSSGNDILQVALDGSRTVTPLVHTPFDERNGEVSPDGRWLAYDANNSGEYEVYVRPYPHVNDAQWQVSMGGGTQPAWAPNGQELFYVAPTGALMRVGVASGPSWTMSAPAKFLDGPILALNGNSGRSYDIARDGQRFLIIKRGEPGAASPPLIVVQHFDDELKGLLPAK